EPDCAEPLQHLFTFRVGIHMKQGLFQRVDLYLFKPFADGERVIRKPLPGRRLVDYLYEGVEYLVLLTVFFNYRVLCTANFGLMAHYRTDCSFVASDP